MYFKRLEMHGFKSFAEPVTIEFHQGVTCIVGPNGSGKSNISDAIRWVLGEQSPKTLRGGKMEEVIFAGTANRKSRGMAEVTLVIDNSEGILPTDYNEVAITRRMYRSGESEYLINNNPCRLRDIRELIMDTGIGVDGYSIIGQGKIADIVSSKPESRREIFEEAAGVVMYKSKKAESERKLASAAANLDRVEDIISEIEGRIDGLKEDSVKAKEYLEVKDRLRELEINITLRTIEKLENSAGTIKADLEELSREIEGAEAEKAKLSEELAQNRRRSDNLEGLGDEAKDRLLSRVSEISELTGSITLQKERLTTLERDIARVSAEQRELCDKKAAELRNREELEIREREISAGLAETEKKFQEKMNIYADVTEEASSVAEQLNEDRNEMYSLYNEEAAKESEAKSLESYKTSLENRRSQLVEENRQISVNKEATASAVEKAQKERNEMRAELEALKGRLSASHQESEKLDAELNETEKKESGLQIQLSQHNTRRKTIEEMENNYEGYNGAVRFIMKKKQKGIEGVAAELMKVPDGLEIAVETAMGASMQNVVCAGDRHAKAAIQALKEHRAGRLTFLPVESIRSSRIRLPEEVVSSPEFRGLACDLIEYDKRYDNIFVYLLGRVAVVKTMDGAIELSKKVGSGIRFVTPEGEIVNASGAITGGKYRNASAHILERKSEIERLKHKIEETKEALNQIDSQKNDIAVKRRACILQIRELEEGERRLEEGIVELNARIKSVTDSSKDMDSNAERYMRQLDSVEADLKKAENMAEQLKAEAEDCRAKGEEIKLRISQLMKKQEVIQEKSEKASEEITSVRIEKNKWESDKENIIRLLDRIKTAAADLDTQISDKEGQRLAFEEEQRHILSGRGETEEALRRREAEKEEIEEYISRISAEKAELTDKISSFTSAEASMGEKLNSLRDQKYQQEIKLTRNETQLDSFKEKLWEDFEISYLQAVEYRKEDFVMSSAQKESRELKVRLREIGDVNVGAIEEYVKVKERYEFLTVQRNDITAAIQQLKDIVEDMEKSIKTRFKDNFDKVVINFEETFRALFGGGHAELRLDNGEDLLEAGIEIIAQPPGKKLQNINLMSGGEKTMTAIALMFAVLKTTPTPFCILDEVEAALDDNNIERFARYLHNFEDIQFAIVTHQRATMEHADVLYGVTMPEQGISKVLSLRLGDKFDFE